jgi:hypothetical protein
MAQPPPPQGGQWVFNTDNGWIWAPNGPGYTYYPASGYPYTFVYEPGYGWNWIVAPWVFGGNWPYQYYPYTGPFYGRYGYYHGVWGWYHPWGYDHGYREYYGPEYVPLERRPLPQPLLGQRVLPAGRWLLQPWRLQPRGRRLPRGRLPGGSCARPARVQARRTSRGAAATPLLAASPSAFGLCGPDRHAN